MSLALYALLAAVLTASNFGYQAFTGQDWARAAERSWFQLIALGLAAWWARIFA